MRTIEHDTCLIVFNPDYEHTDIFDLHEGDEMEFNDRVILTLSESDYHSLSRYIGESPTNFDEGTILRFWEDFLTKD